MIIRTVEAESWRCISRARLEFGQGLNVVSGPNEAGKSSLMEAMYHALTGEAHSGKREYKSLVPWNTRVKAKVSLGLETDDGQAYRVAKAFPHGGAALYYLGGNEERKIAEDRETDTELLARLGLREELKGLLDLLWVGQGEGTDLLRNSRKSLDEPVERMVKDVIRGRLMSPAAERLYAELQREREGVFTTRGLKEAAGSRGGEISRLQREYERLTAEEQRLAEQLARMEESKRQYEELHRRIEELERQQSEAERRVRCLREKRRAYAEWEQLESRLKPLERALASYRQKERERTEAASRADRLRRALHTAVEEEARTLEEKQRQGEERRREAAALQEELRFSAAVSREQVAEAEKCAAELRRTETMLEKQPIRIELDPENPFTVRTVADGGKEEEWQISEPLSLTVSRSFRMKRAGEFVLSVTGPLSGEEFEELRQRRDRLQRQLGEKLEAAGADSLERLKELAEQRREKESRLASLRELGGEEEQQRLERQLAELEQTREQVKPAEEPGEKGGGAAPPDEEYAGLSAAELQRRLSREENAIASAEAGMREILEQAEVPDEKSLRERLEELRRAAEEKRRELEVTEPTDVERVEERTVSDAERGLEELRSRLMSAREEKAKLEGSFGGTEDYPEQLADCASRRSTLAEQLRREWTDVYALETILSLMREEKERVEEQLYRPLEERVSAAFAELTGERYGGVSIGEGLSGVEVAARTYDGSEQPVRLADLSFGTREQLSFLLRLALAEALSERQRQVMVLDDSFVNSDAHRLSWLLGETARAAQTMQCILFTCSAPPAGELPEGTRFIEL